MFYVITLQMPFEIEWEDVKEILRKPIDIFEREDQRENCIAPRIRIDIDYLQLRADEYTSLLHLLFLLFQPIKCERQFPFRVRFLQEHCDPCHHSYYYLCINVPSKLTEMESFPAPDCFIEMLSFYFDFLFFTDGISCISHRRMD